MRTRLVGLAIIYSVLLITMGVSALHPSSGSFGGRGGISVAPGERPTSHSAVDWVNENPSNGPTARGYMPMTYATGSDRVVLFGGIVDYDSVALDNATWTYDLNTNTWAQANPHPRPPPLGGHSIAYDAGSDRVIVFGGCSSCPPNPWVGNFDTWAYDVGAGVWTNLAPDPHPPTMIGGRMAYDAQSDRIILFGGLSTSFTYYSQTWAYDLNTNTWTDMAPSTRPPARNYQGMAYDAQSDRIILFGGGTSVIFGDTWAYDFDLNAWTSMQPSRAPPARDYVAMVYDSQSDRVILAGSSPGGIAGDNQTWAYDFNSNTWSNMNSPAPPTARSRNGLAYDSESDRAILFGGLTPSTAFSSDTWSYDYVANHPAAPIGLQASSGDTRVELTWATPPADGGSPITNYRMYRGTSLRFLALLVEVGNVLSHTDTTVTNGITYYYAVSAVTAAGEGQLSIEDFTTPLPTPDSVNPTIVITSPADGMTLTSTVVAISGTASDNIAIERVELSTDGVSWTRATGTATWSGTLTLTEGPNTIRARAMDTSGNTASASVNVTVGLAPPPPPWVLIAGVAALAAGGAVAAVVLWRRRKRNARPPGT